METKKNKSNRKPINFLAALYIANNYGPDLSDEQLSQIAKHMNYKPKVLIGNYKFIVAVNKITDDYR